MAEKEETLEIIENEEIIEEKKSFPWVKVILGVLFVAMTIVAVFFFMKNRSIKNKHKSETVTIEKLNTEREQLSNNVTALNTQNIELKEQLNQTSQMIEAKDNVIEKLTTENKNLRTVIKGYSVEIQKFRNLTDKELDKLENKLKKSSN
jgi:DNA repair ATPase RecN